MHTNRAAFAAALLSLSIVSSNALACSVCGCSLSTDWSVQGITRAPGFSLDFLFQYYNQDELKNRTGSVDRNSIQLPTDREIQQETLNRNYTLFANYVAEDWAVTAQVPYFDRYHTTIAEGDTDISTSHTESIGDVRLFGRYFGITADHSIGLQFGLKLPTGSFNNNFISGPQAGTPLDRGLQPGTGTTDLLLGISKFGAMSRDWDYFAQALLQLPLYSRDEFRPSTSFNVNAGVRYVAFGWIAPALQINARIEDRESGANSDAANSGATLLFLSPGFTVNFGHNVFGYAYVSLPIYHNVNGYQLEYSYAVTAGVQISL